MGCGEETGFLGFWGFGVICGGIETGFLLWVSEVIGGMRRRNPVSGVLGFWGDLWGYRNRVSVVNIRSYLWDAEKKPGFWVWQLILLVNR